MRREGLEDSDIRQAQSENLTEAVLDFAEGIGIIKTYNLLGEKSAELTENFRESRKTSIDFEENHAPWQRRLNLVYGLGVTVVVTLALLLHSRGLLDSSLAVGVMLFVFDLFGPMKALYGQSTRLTVMNSCMDRIEEVFAEAELSDKGTAHIPAWNDGPEVEFRNVSFAYGEKETLRDISFCLEKNQMAALVGPSGGGKSTIASLLARFWDVKSGQVLVRGVDIRTVPLSELMDHISMVFQRVYLFQDTIYNNISMGRPDGVVEQIDILKDHGNMFQQAVASELPHIVPAHCNASVVHIIEPGDQAANGGLAAAGRPHNSGGGVLWDGKADIPQNRPCVAAELYIAERDIRPF
jgi:ATP-binding cassette subfamily B protein